MLLPLGNFTLFALLIVNLFGLTLFTGLWLRNTWLALTSGPLLLCTLLMMIECHQGLGDISWLLPITTALSFYLIWEVEQSRGFLDRWKSLPLEAWRAGLAFSRNPSAYVTFLLTFLYCIAWRWVHPDIDKGTELIADLSRVCSYLSGATLPVKDFWFPPLSDTHYYAFQYYGSGVLGRIFELSPGVTYNISFAVAGALAFTAGIGVIFTLAKQWWVRLLASAHLVWGGTGVTLFIYLFKSEPYLWDYMRFIGNPTLKGAILSPYILGYDHVLSDQDLPSENLGYCIFLGDYHPVLLGFYLLAFGALVAALWTKIRLPSLMFLFGATIPWTVIGDPWNLPVTGIAMLGFLAYHSIQMWKDGSWKAFIMGGIVCVFMIFPFFRFFTADSTDIQSGLELVPWDRHTPFLSFCIYFLPTLGLMVFGVLSGRSGIRSVAGLFFIILMFTEFFYNHDEYSGSSDRFNSCLKWWPCVTELTVIVLAPLILDTNLKFPNFLSMPGWFFTRENWRELKIKRPVFTLAALLLTFYPVLYAYQLNYQLCSDAYYGQFRGKLNGSDYLTSGLTAWEQSANNQVVSNLKLYLDQLSMLPRDWVFAEHPDESFTENGAMTLFSNHQCFMGWVGHEELWRGGSPALRYRFNTLTKIYSGEMPDAGPWLASQKVDIVLWFKRDLDKDTQWETINKAMQPNFHWREFITEGDGHHVGYWENNHHATE